jgi:hypothetical protein
MSLRRLIQDRELDLPDGSRLLNHDKYDSLMHELASKNTTTAIKLHRIHPSFRLIATAEPPSRKDAASVSATPTSTSTPTPAINKQQNTNWLTSEVLNLFLYQQVDQLSVNMERFILEKMFKLNEGHERLLNVLELMKERGRDDVQLRHVSKLFSLRKVIRLARRLNSYPNMDLRRMIENECLFKFMPQLNKEILTDFFEKNGLKRATNEMIVEEEDLLSDLKVRSHYYLKNLIFLYQRFKRRVLVF